MSGPKSRPLPEPVAAWAQYRRATGKSPGTIKGQSNYVARLARRYDLDTVTTAQLVDWLAGHDWQISALRSATSALRMYFRWAQRTGRRADDPADVLDPVNTPPPCPKPVPETVLASVLRDVDDDTRLMVLLAAYAGLRRSEIATLRREHLEGDLLRVTGKGGRTRIIPIGGVLLGVLTERPGGWIFPGRNPREHICPDVVGRRLSELLPHGYTGHKLRHRYATRVHAGSKDLLALQQLLGHSSPETTRRYVLTDIDQLRQAAAAALD